MGAEKQQGPARCRFEAQDGSIRILVGGDWRLGEAVPDFQNIATELGSRAGATLVIRPDDLGR